MISLRLKSKKFEVGETKGAAQMRGSFCFLEIFKPANSTAFQTAVLRKQIPNAKRAVVAALARATKHGAAKDASGVLRPPAQRKLLRYRFAAVAEYQLHLTFPFDACRAKRAARRFQHCNHQDTSEPQAFFPKSRPAAGRGVLPT